MRVAARLAKWSWENLWEGVWWEKIVAILGLIVAAIITLIYAVVIAPLCATIELPFMAVVAVFSDDTNKLPKALYLLAIVAMVAAVVASVFFPPFTMALIIGSIAALVVAQMTDYYSKMGEQYGGYDNSTSTTRDGNDKDETVKPRKKVNPLGRPPSGTSIAVMFLVGSALIAGVVLSVFFPLSLPVTLPALAFGVSWLSTVAVLTVGAATIMGTSFFIGGVALAVHKGNVSDRERELNPTIAYENTNTQEDRVRKKEDQVRKKGEDKAVQVFQKRLHTDRDEWVRDIEVDAAELQRTQGEEAAKQFYTPKMVEVRKWFEDNMAKIDEVKKDGGNKAVAKFQSEQTAREDSHNAQMNALGSEAEKEPGSEQ